MRLIFPVIVIYCLIALASTLQGIRILNNSDARLCHALAGISSQTIAEYKAAKGCEK